MSKPATKPRCRFALMLLLLVCCAPEPLFAQQPFATDDADVTPKGVFHFEFSNNHDFLRLSAFPTRRQNTARAELDYGLVEQVEIGVQAPLITLYNVPGTTPRRVTGIGDTTLSVKYNFRSEKENSIVPALTVSGSIELPTGDESSGLGSGITDYSLNGVMQKSLTERTIVRLNGGTILLGNTETGAIGIETRSTILTGGVSLVRRFTSRLYLGAEITGARAKANNPDESHLQLQVGGNYLLSNTFSIDFGVLRGFRDPDPRTSLLIGFAFDF